MPPTLAIALLMVPAAPVPKPTAAEALQVRFGTPSDPGKACTAKLAGDTLILSLKADTAPGVGDDRKALPTFTREVTGDFTAVVRVRCGLPKGAERVTANWAETGGGIVFVRDDGRVYCAGVHEYEYRGERMRMVPLPLGHGPTGQRRLDATTSRYVKIRRSAATMELSSSADGKEWEKEYTFKNFNDSPMRVGVYATHNLTVESVVELDQFSLTRQKEEKK